MFTVCRSTDNCFSKDARNAAPSVTSAHSCANSDVIAFVAGIAVAVSVFLYALIGIFNLGMIIHIIIPVIMLAVIITSVMSGIIMITPDYTDKTE